MKILIIRVTRIGDVLLTTPVVKVLKENYPNAKISFMVSEEIKDILIDNPYIDEIITIKNNIIYKILKEKNKKEVIFSFLKLLKKIKNSNFDWIIDFHGTGKTAFFSIISFSKNRIGKDKKSFSFVYNYKYKTNNKIHIVNDQINYLKFINPNMKYNSLNFVIKTNSKKLKDVNNIITKDPNKIIIGIVPFTSHIRKNWNISNFVDICNWINENLNAKIVILGDSSREEDWKEITKKINEPVLNLIGKTSIKELIEIINGLDFLITGDTVPMHIAVAVNTPLISLIKSKDVNTYGPYNGNNITIIKAHDSIINSIKKEEVINAIKERVKVLKN